MIYTSKDYDRMKDLTPAEFDSEPWEQTTAENYEYMLEVLPPIRWKGKAFMVGEMLTTGKAGSIYDAFVQVGKHFYCRPAPLNSFDPTQYAAQVKAQFATKR